LQEIGTANRIQIVGSSDLLYSLDGLRIQFKYPELFDDTNVALMIAKSIDYIIVNGEQIFVDDLSDQEIDDLTAFLAWVGKMDLNGFPPKPDLMATAPSGTADVSQTDRLG
jgi:hypothetical protein